VFFRKQDELDNDLQKELAQRLGALSGKPETSKLHIHPVSNSGRRLGGKDDEISVISSDQAKELYKNRFLNFHNKKQSAKDGWHSDITFEPIPSDYAILRLTELPKTGGGKSYSLFAAQETVVFYPSRDEARILTTFTRYVMGLRLRAL
jgi:alpha-ketoglutarate-dependent taurine dioxygenase